MDGSRLVVFGASRGSEAALLLAVHFPTLVHGVIAISPSNVSVGSYPGCGGPAWTFAGRPVAYQCSFGPNEDSSGAAIPVGRSRARLLLVIWFDGLSGDSPQANPTARERFWPRLLRFVRTAPA